MEKRLKKNDYENEYKYYILQMGRKYTYVGFSGLHKPLSVHITPDFFLYNENFHNVVEDKNKIYEIIQMFSKKEKGETELYKETGYSLSTEKEKSDELTKKVSFSNNMASPAEGADNFSTHNRAEDYATSAKSIIYNGYAEDDEGNYIDGDENNNKLEKHEPNEKRKEKGKNLIYHYEYKYNQDINLWNKFFEEFVFKIFHNFLKTSNKAKKVIVVLNMFIPTIIKYALCKSLIENFEYSSISYINDLVSPLYLCNCNTCVVIDLGYLNCRLLPIINGFPLYHHYTYINNGGFYINNEIKRLLKEQYIKRNMCKGKDPNNDITYSSNGASSNSVNNNRYNNMTCSGEKVINVHEKKKNIDTDISSELLNYYYNLYPLDEILNVIDSMTDDNIENMKIRYCYLKNEKTNFSSDKYVLYQFKNYEIIIEPNTRWKACEILFNMDHEQNIYSLLSSIVDKLNIFESSVFYNILLVGGCSNIKGIISKITQTFYEVLKEKKTFIKDFGNKINFLLPKISPNLRQFIGASICSNLENLPDYTQEHIINNVLYDHLNEDVYLTFKK
ncbi:actin-like protein [Plasmodium brasilianum]|uniref:Actin-like protein, putative n=2 Tax=Plasmodium (Plasmodium) TaxID=418103 RepID=A0A1D3JL02_PLAMA|nr:actin-like protein, putative [Plasmodium malariae]KAI4840981.1 actin-like protein [Plasmodium brasilianum]SBT87182.1 actin-like protein, putative [Plasmodium malariae]